MIDPFKTFMLVFDSEDGRFFRWNDDLLKLLENVHEYETWYIMECEIIEGLSYPKKLIARSCECYISSLLSRN